MPVVVPQQMVADDLDQQLQQHAASLLAPTPDQQQDGLAAQHQATADAWATQPPPPDPNDPLYQHAQSLLNPSAPDTSAPTVPDQSAGAQPQTPPPPSPPSAPAPSSPPAASAPPAAEPLAGPPAPSTPEQAFNVPQGQFSPFDATFQKYAGDLANNPEFLSIVATGTLGESGWNPNNQAGDGGHSWGLFQMYDQGAGAGMGNARLDPDAASAVMVPKYAAAYKQVKAQQPNLSGAALASLVSAMAERPYQWDDPNSAARQNYAKAYQQVVGGTAAPSVDLSQPPTVQPGSFSQAQPQPASNSLQQAASAVQQDVGSAVSTVGQGVQQVAQTGAGAVQSLYQHAVSLLGNGLATSDSSGPVQQLGNAPVPTPDQQQDDANLERASSQSSPPNLADPSTLPPLQPGALSGSQPQVTQPSADVSPGASLARMGTAAQQAAQTLPQNLAGAAQAAGDLANGPLAGPLVGAGREAAAQEASLQRWSDAYPAESAELNSLLMRLNRAGDLSQSEMQRLNDLSTQRDAFVAQLSDRPTPWTDPSASRAYAQQYDPQDLASTEQLTGTAQAAAALALAPSADVGLARNALAGVVDPTAAIGNAAFKGAGDVLGAAGAGVKAAGGAVLRRADETAAQAFGRLWPDALASLKAAGAGRDEIIAAQQDLMDQVQQAGDVYGDNPPQYWPTVQEEDIGHPAGGYQYPARTVQGSGPTIRLADAPASDASTTPRPTFTIQNSDAPDYGPGSSMPGVTPVPNPLPSPTVNRLALQNGQWQNGMPPGEISLNAGVTPRTVATALQTAGQWLDRNLLAPIRNIPDARVQQAVRQYANVVGVDSRASAVEAANWAQRIQTVLGPADSAQAADLMRSFEQTGTFGPNATPEQQQLAADLKGFFDSSYQQAKAHGYITGDVTAAAGGPANYFPHVWADTTPAQGAARGALSPNSFYSQGRTYLTVDDALQAGKTPVSISDAVARYVLNIGDSEAKYQLVQDLKAANPNMVRAVAPGAQVPPDMVMGSAIDPRLSSPLRNYAFDPSIVPVLKNVTEGSAIRNNVVGQAVLSTIGTAKQSLFSLSGFHAYTEGMYAYLTSPSTGQAYSHALLSPSFYQEQRFGPLADTFVQAARAGVTGLTGRVTDAPDTLTGLAGVAARGALPGLGGAAAGYEGTLNAKGSQQDAVRNAAIAGAASFGLGSALAGKITAGIFERAIPLAKVTAWDAFTKSGMPADQAAAAVNRTFGGLNYAALGRSQTFQDTLRLTLQAPDWNESTVRQLGTAFFGKDTGAGFSRGLLARAVLATAALTETLNMATTGHSTLQNDPGHQMQVQLTTPSGSHVYAGVGPGNLQAYLDLANTRNIGSFTTGRLAGVPSTTLQGLSNQQYLAGPPITTTGESPLASVAAQGAHALSTAAPTVASGAMDGSQHGINAAVAGLASLLGLNLRYQSATAAKQNAPSSGRGVSRGVSRGTSRGGGR